MPVLIPDIFKDPMEYLRAEEILRRLFDRIKCEEYRGPMWTRWWTYTFNNGTRLYDDSTAVYTHFCEERRKGVAIWLADPKKVEAISNEPETFFEAETQVRDPEVTKIACLDITCVLSDENLKKAESLIRLYMVDDVTPEAWRQASGSGAWTDVSAEAAGSRGTSRRRRSRSISGRGRGRPRAAA